MEILYDSQSANRERFDINRNAHFDKQWVHRKIAGGHPKLQGYSVLRMESLLVGQDLQCG